jgi:hypothetical protein
MCDMLFIVDVLQIPFIKLSESEKITKVCSEFIFSLISTVSPIDSASVVKVDAILADLSYPEFPANIITYKLG